MNIRPATHSGSWYSANPDKLNIQLSKYLSSAPSGSVPNNRILIGPHAGYTFAGEVLAQTYKSWDLSQCEKLIIMGPSHHVYFKGSVMLSLYDKYHTPFGDLDVDTELVDELCKLDPKFFKKMSFDMDDDEHSFEMHMPYIYKQSKTVKPRIVPIMISHTTRDFENKLAQYLSPYFQDPKITFAISSDFCHWGSRFRYTAYTPSTDVTKLTNLSMYKKQELPIPIYESIEILDKLAMNVISTREYNDFKDYIEITGNTICGERPIGVLLKLIHNYELETGKTGNFKWLGYMQSSQVTDVDDSSVSYASGYCVI